MGASNFTFIAVAVAAFLVVTAVAEQDQGGLGQMVDEFVIEDLGVFAVGSLDADGGRPIPSGPQSVRLCRR